MSRVAQSEEKMHGLKATRPFQCVTAARLEVFVYGQPLGFGCGGWKARLHVRV